VFLGGAGDFARVQRKHWRHVLPPFFARAHRAFEVSSFAGRVQDLTSVSRSEDDEFLLLAAFKVAASSGESGEKELLRQIGADAFRCSNQEVAEDEADTSI
jgi:hypothetical protein